METAVAGQCQRAVQQGGHHQSAPDEIIKDLHANRMVSLSKEEGCVHLHTIEWTLERLQTGVAVKLKKVSFKIKLFKLVAPNGDID